MKPWVIFNSAMSLDGRIGKAGKEIKLSDKLDENRVQELRNEVDAILLGVETIKEKPLKLGGVFSESKKPRIVVIDPKAELPLENEIFSSFSSSLILVVSTRASRSRVRNFKKKAANVITLGKYTVNLQELMDKLYRGGIRNILLEDQSGLTRRMFQENLVDELYILIAPKIIGDGVNLIQDWELKEEKKLSLEGITQYGDGVLLHYFSSKSASKPASEEKD